MSIQEKVRAKIYACATAYGLGKNKLYARLLSAASIPFTFLTHTLLSTQYKSLIFFTLIITLSGFIIHSIAASRMQKEEYSHLIVHHLIGVFLTFWGIPFKIKLVVFGFIVFHLITFVHARFDNSLTKHIPYVSERTKFFLASILGGISMNMYLRLLLWIAR
jgi:phosphatidylglycerophosphatase A